MARARVTALAATSYFWRRFAYLGARYGPRWWLRFSPIFFGLAFALFLPRQRRAVLRNLRRVRGRTTFWRECREVASTFALYARCLAEGLASGRPGPQAQCDVAGQERLKACLASGRGAILVTAHVGPWDAAARLLGAHLGMPVKLVMAAEPHAAAQQFHDALRRQHDVEVVQVGNDPLAALPLLQHLEQGAIVAMQLDRPNPGSRYLELDFFGEPARVPVGPFLLAAAARVAVVPVFARWIGFQHYELRVLPAVAFERRPDPSELMAAARAIVVQMEAYIREVPTQWFNFEPDVVRSDRPPQR